MQFRTNKFHKGFTLIEIMIVVSIMGLILAMGMPSFVKTLHKEGMNKAVKDIREACLAARADAILHQKTADLIFHPADRTISAPGFKEATLPNNVEIQILGVNFVQYERADEAKIHFFPNGTSDEFTIVVQDDQFQTRQISLDVMTALPEMEVIR
ncbi:MAG TPA: type II secretion system protein [Verrucomicrobiae bacterium]|jgi:prepilin-type N-terminal cleavage/methylation domain-containing protein|nr:type II secretion system protein [Verrucomicrobiae bacterium]